MRHAVACMVLVLKRLSNKKHVFKSYFSKSLKWDAGFESLSMTSKAAVGFSPYKGKKEVLGDNLEPLLSYTQQ